MTESILLPIFIVSVVGLASGVILSVAAAVFHVPVDQRQQALRDALPGANCGACGYAGCDGYAEAIAAGNADISRCTPGGADAKAALADIMGVQAGEFRKITAFVHCNGTNDNTAAKMQYAGEATCAAAGQMFAGPGKCAWGCMGFGDCAAACEYSAIHICDGIAVIDPDLCVGCAKCVTACPKGIIEMAPADTAALIFCASHDKGPVVRQACSVGCIGCTKCVKACPEDAMHMDGPLAVVDYDKCTACGKCAEVCPQDCILIPKSAGTLR